MITSLKFQAILILIYTFLDTTNGTYRSCTRLTNDVEGQISNRYYSNNMDCTWIIRRKDSNHRIAIGFTGTFDLEEGYDRLIGIDLATNAVLFNLTGRNNHNEYLPDGNVKIMFHSDASTSGSGFVLVYKNYPSKCPLSTLLISELESSGSDNYYLTFEKNISCSWVMVSIPVPRVYDYMMIEFEKTEDNFCSNEESYMFTEEDGTNQTITCFEDSPIPEPSFFLFQRKILVQYEKLNDTESTFKAIFHPKKFIGQGGNCSDKDYIFCNPMEKLGCNGGKCDCYLPAGEMVYSDDHEECVSTFRAQCEFPYGILLGKVNSSSCSNETQCIDGVCECDDEGYFESFDGICTVKRGFGEACNRTVECHQNASLICLPETGTCGCDPDLGEGQIVENGICKGALNRPCVNDRCALNTICSDSTSKCVCDYGYSESSNGKCQGGHGMVCSEASPCSDLHFYCIEGFCKCKSPNRKQYSLTAKSCLSKVYGDCKNNSDCLTNMECIAKAGSAFQGKQCHCADGFAATLLGECLPSYGSACGSARSIPKNRCYPSYELHCINGFCGCFDDMHVYNKNKGKCVGIIGAMCKTNEECVENTRCIKDIPISQFGRCELHKNDTLLIPPLEIRSDLTPLSGGFHKNGRISKEESEEMPDEKKSGSGRPIFAISLIFIALFVWK